MDINSLGFDGGIIGIVGAVGAILYKKLNKFDDRLSKTMGRKEIKEYVDESLDKRLKIIEYQLTTINDILQKFTKVTIKQS